MGELVRIGAERGRSVKPDLKVGICGEHGGDPQFDRFLQRDRIELRELLALPRSGGPSGCGARSAGNRSEG